MVGVARDLTREKEKERTDREIARLEAFNKNIIASLNDGIQIIDPNGIITFANKRLEALLEYEPGELIGMHYSGVVCEEGHSHFRRLADAGKGPRDRSSFETSFLSKTGKKIRFWVNASPLVEDARIVGTITVVTDISEIQSLKEELFQSEKMSLVGTLASEVAHEINNPLGGLIMSVQMLLQDMESGGVDLAVAAEELKEIENDARRCKRITQKLLDFSRRVPEERRLLDLTAVIEDALLLVQRQVELENISFTKSYDRSLPPVRVNANRIQQVIINMVRNARDAMPGGGRISIGTSLVHPEGSARWVRVSISDSGPGVPREIGNRVFNPFVTTKRGSRGTGLGLAVSKRIVEEHGGHITLDRSKGGAVFHIDLPAGGSGDLEVSR